MKFRGKTVALAVSGSIAAFKAVEVARALLAEGVRVVPLMTRAATEFLGPATLSGICAEPVALDMFAPAQGGEAHIDLANTADVLAIVPATADLLSRLATGRADDLVTALAMTTPKPIIVAPAMHFRLWSHPATQRNVETLRADGRVRFVGPVEGPLASGERGVGRMAEPQAVVATILGLLGRRDLVGMRLVVTAGPTVEDLDPVRFLSNRSTGTMGFAVAERAAARGADVTLIAGPVERPTPVDVRRVEVRGAESMRAALDEELGPDLGGADALVMAAAVADYVPREVSATKIKKGESSILLELVKAPDLLREVGERRASDHPVLVGFALETGDDASVVAYARQKLASKRVDLIVANSAAEGLGGPANRATFVSADRVEPLASMDKRDLADEILDRVRDLRAERSGRSC